MPIPIPEIVPVAPITDAAVTVEEKVFDKLWIANLVIQGFDLNKDVTTEAELVYYRTLPDGSREMKPSSSIQIKVENVFQRAATDPELAQVMGGIINFVIKVGKEQGVVA